MLNDAEIKRLLEITQTPSHSLDTPSPRAQPLPKPLPKPYCYDDGSFYTSIFYRKERAGLAARKALSKGEIVCPFKCEDCNTSLKRSSLQMHHEDYDKPLEVVWLCRNCHATRHKQQHHL